MQNTTTTYGSTAARQCFTTPMLHKVTVVCTSQHGLELVGILFNICL